MTDASRGATSATMGTRGTGRVRTAVVWDVLRRTVDELSGPGGRRLEVIDAGGGTGGFAVPLAGLGHRVTVVDASPDALAALERRAAEAGVTVDSVQGDAGDLLDLVGADRADLVLCHSVLEYTEDPAAAMAALAGTVRPGGAVSVLAAGQVAAAVHRALAGHFDEARRVLEDPAGRWGERDPVPLRFTRQMLTDLVTGAGLRVAELHGVRIFADLVSGGLLDDPEAVGALIELETAAAVHPVLCDLAAQLHVLARR